ncbi:ATP-binding cassette domain-containing protein [Clostridium sp. MCC353]|uniref:ABC transporter ATP-binding protein n=1 Tax=Clostridium sp. MCC353 TaxID=2592646 RepID=UPI001C00BBF4|nr:ABC transporter ATP-binding protein [Clostridium sp. MCC353]MBT9775611.1 ATP-binding cassette domain-containing protein [Clostridium sp. MCC353]
MIEVTDIWKRYKHKSVLEGVSFSAAPGECVGIAGGNGCGKTTLFSVLSGTVRADKGSMKYQGQEILGSRRILSDCIAYVPQENPLMEELSAKDNLRLYYRGDKKKMEEDLDHGTAAMLGIGDFLGTDVGRLSGGMKKRLSIACALSNHAPVLIMDEPGAALDLICKEEIRNYLVKYMAAGGTVLLASHELEELSLCSKLYVLNHGKLEQAPTGLSAGELVSRFEK